jgi:hypothetical protein
VVIVSRPFNVLLSWKERTEELSSVANKNVKLSVSFDGCTCGDTLKKA